MRFRGFQWTAIRERSDVRDRRYIYCWQQAETYIPLLQRVSCFKDQMLWRQAGVCKMRGEVSQLRI